MGTNFSYDCSCWKVYLFESKKARDEWVDDHKYHNGNIVAEPITRKVAYRIMKVRTSKYSPNGDGLAGRIIDMGDGSIDYMPC